MPLLRDFDAVPRFDRRFFGTSQKLTRIGDGGIGGKAGGLAFIRRILGARFEAGRFSGIRVEIPTLTVIATDVFDTFMERNHLYDSALSDLPDDRIAHAFQNAELPIEILGDLRSLIDEVRQPLAVRSSSLLEDTLHQPFAGVYATKMIPNNQPDVDERFRRLAEAIRLIYASMFFKAAKSYVRAAKQDIRSEKMAVILQEVVGRRHGGRFYPDVSAVGRSHNFYPFGQARPEEGVVNLALGLGKTIVDGGITWTYSPAHPAAPPPFGSMTEILKNTQLDFWAVNVGKAPAYDPVAETEFLVRGELADADYDGVLGHIASTYDPLRDRLVSGTGSRGPRVVNFAPLLLGNGLPFNDTVAELLSVSREAVDAHVEIELAMSFDQTSEGGARLGFLQVRPMVVEDALVEITSEEMESPVLVAASDRAMGNGVIDSLTDVVYVRPEKFEAKMTRTIATDIERINNRLLDEGRSCLLMGFGRWGSSDPWLGIPVTWGQIGQAKVIVEATLPSMNVDPSQGSHFFHNMTSFRVCYLSVHHNRSGVDWKWLDSQPAVSESEHVRHVRLKQPLIVKVDGRTGRAGVWRQYGSSNAERG